MDQELVILAISVRRCFIDLLNFVSFFHGCIPYFTLERLPKSTTYEPGGFGVSRNVTHRQYFPA
jgi:hypothetical protein